MKRRLRIFGAITVGPLVLIGFAAAALTAEPSTTRPAYPYEARFCQDNYDQLGPITGDCTVVPLAGYVTPDGTVLDGSIQEDDPYGRWDCRTMGNHVCGDENGNLTLYITYADGNIHGFELSAPDRPGCFMEPSNTRAGYEVIFYTHISGRGAPEFIGDPLGFEVNCPTERHPA